LPILWALAAALSFSIGQALVSRGLSHSNATTAAWFTSGVSGLILWLISLSQPFPSLTTRIVLGISAAALFSPFLARVSLYMAFSRLGLSRPTVIVGTAPLWAAVLAILLLGEPFTLQIGFGTLATTLGVIFLAYEKLPRTDWKKIHLTFAFFAAFCFGARDAVARFGVAGFSSPLVAAALAPSVACVLLSLLFFSGAQSFRYRLEKKALPHLCAAGLFYVTAYYSLFTALSGGYVVILAPAIHSAPLFTLVLSYIFWRKEERMGPRVVIGALLVVAGVTIISLARQGI
jgi:drug/metabolite transporter (DMT)-like permease